MAINPSYPQRCVSILCHTTEELLAAHPTGNTISKPSLVQVFPGGAAVWLKALLILFLPFTLPLSLQWFGKGCTFLPQPAQEQ